MACGCCSCDPALEPNPDPYCRQHGEGPAKRQCDLHASPGTMAARLSAYPKSVQARLRGEEPDLPVPPEQPATPSRPARPPQRGRR